MGQREPARGARGVRRGEALRRGHRDDVSPRARRSTSRSSDCSTPTAPASPPVTGGSCRTSSSQALARRPLTVYGDGTQTRSFCYVADMVRGLIALLDSDVPRRDEPRATPTSARCSSWRRSCSRSRARRRRSSSSRSPPTTRRGAAPTSGSRAGCSAGRRRRISVRVCAAVRLVPRHAPETRDERVTDPEWPTGRPAGWSPVWSAVVVNYESGDRAHRVRRVPARRHERGRRARRRRRRQRVARRLDRDVAGTGARPRASSIPARTSATPAERTTGIAADVDARRRGVQPRPARARGYRRGRMLARFEDTRRRGCGPADPQPGRLDRTRRRAASRRRSTRSVTGSLGLLWPTNPFTRRYRQLDADPDAAPRRRLGVGRGDLAAPRRARRRRRMGRRLLHVRRGRRPVLAARPGRLADRLRAGRRGRARPGSEHRWPCRTG